MSLSKRTASRHLRQASMCMLLGAGLTTLGCEDTLSGVSPSISDPTPGSLPTEPGILCRMQHPEAGTPVLVSGGGFSPIPFDIPNDPKVSLPDIVLVRGHQLDGDASDGVEVTFDGEPGQPNADLLSWQSQSQMTFLVQDSLALADGEGMLPIGVHDVRIDNPNGETATAASAFAVVDRPYAAGVDPAMVCVAQADQPITISGQAVLRIGADQPTVSIGGTEFTLDSLADCTAVAHPGLDAELCDSAAVTLGQGSLAAGLLEVVFHNPAPASCTSIHAEDQINLRVVPPPTITSIDPPNLCDSVPQRVLDLTIHGDGFLRVDGQDFVVSVAGSVITPSSIDGCQPLEVQGMSVQTCSSFTITVDTTSFPVGGIEITVTNPAPADCAASSSALFAIVSPPTITGVIPDQICSDVAETLRVTGSGFAQNATVSFSGLAPDSTLVNADGTEITVTYDNGLPAGDYDVTVDNGLGCSGTMPNVLTVNPTPLVFFVDPPVVYNGISIEVTIFTTGLSDTAASVDLIDSSGNRTSISGFTSPLRPNRINAPIPAGLPPDTYEVEVTSSFGCVSSLNGQLVITDTLSVEIEAIDPAFVSPTVPTAVTVTAVDPPPPGGVQFEPVPRVYLNPNPVGAGIVATALRATILESAVQLSAVVPDGMAPGQYDLIVVNPSGAVGLLSQALTVTATEPPFVESVAPGSLDANAVQTASVVGDYFDTAGVDVTLECRDFASGALVGSGTATVDLASTRRLDLTVDAGGIPAGAVCIVVVTNGDGSSYRYSAISFKEPSQNLNAWASGTPMLEPRRGLALVAGRPTDTSRFLFAIGGDDGTAANVKASVEVAPVDPFGQMGAWSYQRNSLANAWDGAATATLAHSFAGVAKIDRFIYLVGGSDGSAATDSLLRAQILDPLDGPEIFDLDARLGDGSEGQGEGLWYYRVAALFPTSDPSNPGGESLAGEVLNVLLPAVPELIVLTLTWEQVPGASGYRVYRTPVADDMVTNLQLLAEVSGGDTLSYEDLGGATDETVTPFPRGSLGVWHAVTGAPLLGPREAHATVAVQDLNTPARWFLYAIGGRGPGGVQAGGEVAIVTVGADGGQSVGPWQPLSATLSMARAGLAGFVVTGADTTVVPAGETYLFLGPGHDGSRAQGIMEVQVVGPDGDLSGLVDTGTPRPPAIAGGAGLAANGFLFLFGGRNDSPTNNDWSGELVAPLPAVELDSGGSLGGGGMLTPRQYQGSAQESAFFFIAGGATNTEVASTSVEQTVQ